MPTTPNFVWPYPQLSDPPDGPDQIGDLALAIDSTVKTVSDRVSTLEAGPFARYRQTIAQTLTTGVITKITFNAAVTTHSDVSVAGSNTFTLNRAGVWVISACISFTNGSGYRSLLVSNSTDSERYAEQSGYPTASGMNLSATTTRHFTAGSQISINGYQTSGGNLDTDLYSERTHIALAWLHS
jgi:hypothetical protein